MAKHDNTLTVAINELIDEAGITSQRGLIRTLVRESLGLGQDKTSRLNLKITTSAVQEMRAAFQLFAPFADVPKVSIFGSARTQRHDALWEIAEQVSSRLADRGWMAVTGAGPGIMEAAATGAGSDRSLGVSIRLPFEEAPNAVVTRDENHVAMKYFFTRKLMLVKESFGFICLPGGFGTMDETFELLTLQQTGKMVPTPIVLLDRPGGTYWRGFERFVAEEIEGYGMISAGDMDRVLVTESVTEAEREITGFWRNYDSLRWFRNELMLRVRERPSDAELAELNERFAPLIEEGVIEHSEPKPHEMSENDPTLDLPRLVFTPKRRKVGELHRLIRAINELPSAPDDLEIPPSAEAHEA